MTRMDPQSTLHRLPTHPSQTATPAMDRSGADACRESMPESRAEGQWGLACCVNTESYSSGGGTKGCE
jgi:hypothetical protein